MMQATPQKEKKDTSVQTRLRINTDQGAPTTKYAKVIDTVDFVLPYDTEKDVANAGNKSSSGSTVNSSPPGTPFSCSTFNTNATTPVSASFPDSPVVQANDTPAIPKMPFTNVGANSKTDTTVTTGTTIVTVEGMPYTLQHLMEMGQALAQARREKRFPATNTPAYNLKATIDDYEDLQRLNDARGDATDTKDDAFRPEIAGLYIGIQRKIQDRDLTYGEVAAESNVRARLNGFANGTGAETGIYNLMRHAVNSVLRHNNLTADSDRNIVDTVVTRVVNEIRTTVQSQVARGAHGVDGVNMNNVMEDVFNAIEDSLSQGVGARLDGQIDDMSNITNAQNVQVNAIAGHVNAIDSHVHAMGNNVNAMGTLLNSTNGNVTTLTTNIGTLQTIVNMLPQMVVKAVQDMLRGILPEIIGPALEQAFAAAISNELVARLQAFTHAAQGTQAQGNTGGRSGNRKRSKFSWFAKLNIFKKRGSRRSAHMGRTHY
ncbi:hypothetical protein F4861DRAFT_502903 [Xylaria intraflava]|nr:hypothetical protein F4861DRAFT_502903 [Xylaria intraflava]